MMIMTITNTVMIMTMTNDENDDGQYREPTNNSETVKLGDKVLTWIMDIQVIKSFAKVVLK